MIDLTKTVPTSSLFFGEHSGIGRLDLKYSSKIKALAELDEANAWYLNIISCSQDRWSEFPPHALSKFQKNLAYQTVMDSLVPDIFAYLAEIANDPWMSYLYSRISTMEKTHALSYSSGADQAFGAKATEFLNIMYTDPKIADRVSDELKSAKEFIQAVRDGWEDSIDNRKLLLIVLSRTLLLEGIKFPFSFYTSWSLNKGYNNCAQGFSQLLIKIAIDEMEVHTTLGELAIKELKKDPSFNVLIESNWFSSMFAEMKQATVDKELKWLEYLLEDGDTPGFNYAIGEHFIKYWADFRARMIKEPTHYNVKKNDIEKWFDAYRNPKGKTQALQEIDNVAYQLGQLVNDLDKFDKVVG